VCDFWANKKTVFVDFVFVRLKVVGELPKLSIGLTDQCVTEILQVLISIPLPERYSPIADEYTDEFAEFVSNYTLITV